MRLVTYREIRARTGITFSRQHIGRLVKAGAFPAPIRYGLRSVGWIEAELFGYLAKAADARRPAANDGGPAPATGAL